MKHVDEKKLAMLILGETVRRYKFITKHQTKEQLLPDIKNSMLVEYPLTVHIKHT